MERCVDNETDFVKKKNTVNPVEDVSMICINFIINVIVGSEKKNRWHYFRNSIPSYYVALDGFGGLVVRPGSNSAEAVGFLRT
jgi:hypothetical protein